MKTYLVQYVQKQRDDATGYDPIGVLVRDRATVVPVAVGAGTEAWEATTAQDFRHWEGTARGLMDRLYDQNGQRFAYALPTQIKADSVRRAAEKLHARIARGLTG